MMIMRVNRTRVTFLAVLCCLVVIVTNIQFLLSDTASIVGFGPSRSPPGWSSSLDHSNPPPSPSNFTYIGPEACQPYPTENSDIVIVVKTGATEVFNKVPAQLVTFLQCAKDDLLIFSDLEQDLSHHHIYDILTNVTEAVKFNNSDFDFYEEQKRIKLMGEDIVAIGNKGSQGWGLDRYKNIHTARKAWELKPNKSWYFFIDADTYIFWSSFVPWLKRHDPDKKLYMGSGVPNKPPFAHGGSGYALSRGAMKILVGENAGEVAKEFDTMVKDDCCGDKVLGILLKKKKIPLKNWDPLVSGQKPRRMGFGPQLWCQPVMTYHHMTPEEISEMWKFEMGRSKPWEPLLLEELYSDYLSPIFPNETRTNWDNVSEDIIYSPPKDESKRSDSTTNPKAYSYKSASNCERACKENRECYQWLWDEKNCKLGKGFKLGHIRVAHPDEAIYTSGWNFERINEFLTKNKGCKGPLWQPYKDL